MVIRKKMLAFDFFLAFNKNLKLKMKFVVKYVYVSYFFVFIKVCILKFMKIGQFFVVENL